MAELDACGIVKARKAYARVLRAFAETGKATAIAAHMGVSDSTISRIKNEKLEDAIVVLYLAGFKIVESEVVTVCARELQGLQHSAMRLLAYESRHGLLNSEEEE